MSTQLHHNRGYVGGGNIAGILGLSPFRTPLDEYLLITNTDQQEISERQREFFEDRRDLEPWAAKKFTRKTGLRVVRTNERYTDAEFGWMKAEIDFEAEDGSNGETKTVHPNAVAAWGDPSTDEPPIYVTAQAMHGLGVTGREKAYVQALIGFDDYRLYEVHRDDELIAELRRRAHDFWRFHVVPRRHPEPTSVDDLLRLYTRDSGRAIEADSAIRGELAALAKERQALKLAEARKATHEYAIKSFMRDAATLTVNGLPAITWRADSRGTRIFRIK